MPTQNSASIKWIIKGREAEVFVSDVEITEHRSVNFRIRIKKLPLPRIPTKGVFFIQTVCVDPESTCLRELTKRAREIRSLREERKISTLLRMVRETFRYPFPSLIQRLEKDNPEDAEWIKEYIKGTQVHAPFSEFIKRGYGECRHYAVLFAILAQAAGLEVILAWCLERVLVNVIRRDTQEPLFVTVPLGEVNAGHAWNEVRIQSGEWVPVDPTKNLNGLNFSEREIFIEANYVHFLSGAIRVSVKGIDEKRIRITIPNAFDPGQAEKDGLLKIELYTKPLIRIRPGGKSEEIPRQVISYRGPLRFAISSACTYENSLLNAACADAEILGLELV